MGEGQSKSKTKEDQNNREDYIQSVLEEQRKMFEKKCESLIKEAQTSAQANNVTKVVAPAQNYQYVGHLNSQSSSMLYPNLNTPDTLLTHSTNTGTSPAARDMVNNHIKTRNNASTSINDNILPNDIEKISEIKSNLGFGTHARTLATPSAPPELLVASIQDQNKRKGAQTINKQSVRLTAYDCKTCGGILGTTIYQCSRGHSSCLECRMSGRTCGEFRCGSTITDMRNRSVEAIIADMHLKTPSITKGKWKISCPNKYDGCKLQFSENDMAGHLKDCPFGELLCPLSSIFGRCLWRGKINQLVDHFDNVHLEHRQVNVNTEMTLLDIKNSSRIVHLVALGRFLFLVNVKVDTTAQVMYMVIQFFGTAVSASKWTYELHVYNKSMPRRKFQYSDVCLSNSVSSDDIFDNNTCAVVPATYLRSFENHGSINYRFYIKKVVE